MNARPHTSVLSPVPDRLQTLKPPAMARDRQDAEPSATADIQSPPLPGKPQLVEVFADSRDVGAVGFALAQVPRAQSILWVQDRMCAQEVGQPHGRALARFRREGQRRWRYWLNRRSRKAAMPWARFRRLLAHYPLPPPRVIHSIYA